MPSADASDYYFPSKYVYLLSANTLETEANYLNSSNATSSARANINVNAYKSGGINTDAFGVGLNKCDLQINMLGRMEISPVDVAAIRVNQGICYFANSCVEITVDNVLTYGILSEPGLIINNNSTVTLSHTVGSGAPDTYPLMLLRGPFTMQSGTLEASGSVARLGVFEFEDTYTQTGGDITVSNDYEYGQCPTVTFRGNTFNMNGGCLTLDNKSGEYKNIEMNGAICVDSSESKLYFNGGVTKIISNNIPVYALYVTTNGLTNKVFISPNANLYVQSRSGYDQFRGESNRVYSPKNANNKSVFPYKILDIHKSNGTLYTYPETVNFSSFTGFSSAVDSSAVKVDSEHDIYIWLPSVTDTAAGSVFAGVSSNSRLYSNRNSISQSDTQTYNVLTEVNVCKVTLDKNGGSGGSNEFYFISGSPNVYYSDVMCTSAISNKTLTLPARSGYTFKGYNVGPSSVVNANGVIQDAAAAYTDTDYTAMAVWTANTYSVRFNANGGSGSMSNQSFTYGESKALTANSFTNTGYTFLGWDTQIAGAEVVYTDKQSVSNLSSANGAVVDLYAVWAQTTFTVSFRNGDNTAVRYIDSATGQTAALNDITASGSVTLDSALLKDSGGKHITPVKEGYVFTGWYTTAAGANANNTALAFSHNTTINSSITLYAGFTPIGTVTQENKDTYIRFGNVKQDLSGFELVGVQLRTVYSETYGGTGLRFVSRVSNQLLTTLKGLSQNSVSYGHIVAFADGIQDSLLTADSCKPVNGIYKVIVSEAVNKLYTGTQYNVFSTVINSIGVSDYSTDFAARPYICYTDASGIGRYHYYTETGNNAVGGGYKANLKSVAQYILNNNTAAVEADTYLAKYLDAILNNQEINEEDFSATHDPINGGNYPLNE